MKKREPNKKNSTSFTKDNQPSGDAKSAGQLKRRSDLNIRLSLETKLFEIKAVDAVIEVAQKEVEEGNIRNMVELIKIAKGNEPQEIITGGDLKIEVINDGD